MRPSPQILLLALLGCGSESSDTTRLQPIVADEVMGIALHDAVGEGTVALPIRQVNTYGAIPTAGVDRAGNEKKLEPSRVRRHRIRHSSRRGPAGKVAEVQVQTASETDVLAAGALASATTWRRCRCPQTSSWTDH